MTELMFTGRPQDDFFRQITTPEVLRQHRIYMPPKIVELGYNTACTHLNYTRQIFKPFWWLELGEEDVINLVYPEQSLYHLGAARVGVQLENLSHETSRMIDDLLAFRLAPKLAELLSFFFNQMIKHLKQASPALVQTT